MNPMVIHGDVEALIVDILNNHTPELAPFQVERISTDLRGYKAPDRWVMVTVEGGFHDIWNVISKPRIDVEVRAELRTTAHDIAQICLGSLFRAVPYSSNGATLSRLTTEMGLINVPDKEEAASYRYIFSLRATCTVHPDSAPIA
jgi:hypothetical protein